MSKEKLVRFSFFPDGFTPEEVWDIPVTEEEFEDLKKPSNRLPYSDSYLAKLILAKTDYEKVTIPLVLGESPKGAKPGKVNESTKKEAQKADEEVVNVPTFYIGGSAASV